MSLPLYWTETWNQHRCFLRTENSCKNMSYEVVNKSLTFRVGDPRMLAINCWWQQASGACLFSSTFWCLHGEDKGLVLMSSILWTRGFCQNHPITLDIIISDLKPKEGPELSPCPLRLWKLIRNYYCSNLSCHLQLSSTIGMVII